MRKSLLLSVMAIFLVSGAFAQNSLFNVQGNVHRNGKFNRVNSINSQEKATTLLSENFSGGALPAGWQNVDNVTGGVWFFTNPGARTINTTSNANGFAIFDSDNLGSDGLAENSDLITAAFDCSAQTSVILSFEHYFYAGWGGAAAVSVIGDNGTTWTSVGAWGATSTANAELFTYDISSVAAGQSQVKIKWNWQGNYSWYWAIDDIMVYAPNTNDLEVVSAAPAFVQSGTSVFPSVTVLNIGAAVQNDFDITVVINDGSSDVYSSTLNVTGAALGSFAEQTFSMTSEWTTPANGAYTMTSTVTLAADEDVSNNQIITNCNVVDLITSYAINGEAETFESVVIPTGTVNEISTFNVTNFPMAMEYAAGEYYFIRNSPAELYTINIADGSSQLVSTISGMTGTPTALAYNWDNSSMYIMFLDGTNAPHLGTIDLATGIATEIGVGTGMVIAMDFANDGTLYATTLEDLLISIDIATGAATTVGNLGIDINYGQDISYDINSGVLYGIVYGDQIGLASFDLTTGAATVIAPLTEQYACFVIPFLVGPQLVEVAPAVDAVDVAIDATVSVTFNVDITEVTYWNPVTPDPGNVVASIVDNVLTLAHDDFDFNTEYTVLVPAGAVSDGADDLAYDVEWSFTTALDPTACNDPSNIVISGIEEYEATVLGQKMVQYSWIVVYGPSGFDPMTEGDQVTVDVATATLIDLDDDTDYEVYVQAVCGAETSGWAGPAAFTTLRYSDAVTSLPFSEDFESGVFPPACWNVINTHPTANWHEGTNDTGFAAQVVYEDAVMMDEWLISPTMDLSSVSGILNVSFDFMTSYYWLVDPYDGADLMLKVSIDGGMNWTILWNEENYGTFTNFTWYSVSVPFTAYAGEANVKIAFNYKGDDGAQTMVDNIVVDFGTNVENEVINAVSVYPNPSNGIVNIAVTENSIVSVMDIAGRTVAMYNVNANDEVSFTQSAGMYIVKVESNGKVFNS
jgi:hypothetical protein